MQKKQSADSLSYSLAWVPTQIRVSGLPFFWQGWNTMYYRVVVNGEVMYVMDPYTLYFFIPIFGVVIRKLGKKWVLMRSDGVVICKKLDSISCQRMDSIRGNHDEDQETPFGDWEYNMSVVGFTGPDQEFYKNKKND